MVVVMCGGGGGGGGGGEVVCACVCMCVCVRARARVREYTDPSAQSWERHTLFLNSTLSETIEPGHRDSNVEVGGGGGAGQSGGGEWSFGAGGADGVGWWEFWEKVSAAWLDPLLEEVEAGVCMWSVRVGAERGRDGVGEGCTHNWGCGLYG